MHFYQLFGRLDSQMFFSMILRFRFLIGFLWADLSNSGFQYSLQIVYVRCQSGFQAGMKHSCQVVEKHKFLEATDSKKLNMARIVRTVEKSKREISVKWCQKYQFLSSSISPPHCIFYILLIHHKVFVIFVLKNINLWQCLQRQNCIILAN